MVQEPQAVLEMDLLSSTWQRHDGRIRKRAVQLTYKSVGYFPQAPNQGKHIVQFDIGHGWRNFTESYKVFATFDEANLWMVKRTAYAPATKYRVVPL